MNGQNKQDTPSPKQEENKEQRKMNVIHQEFSGPLPPPNILQRYDEVVPGAAERILKMAEEQSKHRQVLESKVINSDVINSRLGLIFGFIIGLATIGGGVYLASIGKEGIGTSISLGGLGALVGVFVYGSKSRKKEREDRKLDD